MKNQILSIVYVLMIASAALFVSCEQGPSLENGVEWSQDIKDSILRDAMITTDSIVEVRKNDSLLSLSFFSKSILRRRYVVNSVTGDTLSKTFFSINQDFVLGIETCRLSGDSLEAIVYANGLVGLNQTFYCNGKLRKSGLMLEGKFGVWKEFDENGELIKEENFGRVEQLSKLLKIKYR